MDLCHKVEVPATVTCVDGHGWPRRAGLYASDLLAGHGSGVAIELEALQVRTQKVPQVGMAQDIGIMRGESGCSTANGEGSELRALRPYCARSAPSSRVAESPDSTGARGCFGAVGERPCPSAALMVATH